MNLERLPTKGKYYGSGEAITELTYIVDEVMAFKKARCDCDSYRRCSQCIMETELNYRKEVIKKKIRDMIESIDNTIAIDKEEK